MRVALLGPLTVTADDGRLVEVTGRRLQLLLLRLAVDPDRQVSAAVLVDALWPEEAPADPVNALQSLVSRLRRALGDPRLVTQNAAGYRLRVAPADVDGTEFSTLVAEGRRLLAAGDLAGAVGRLGRADALWRGEALVEAGNAWFATSRRAQWTDLRLGASLDRLTAVVALGRPGEAVAELETLFDANPLNEPIAAALLRALAAAGRVSEALARYEATRRFLSDELGADPGAELQTLHLQLLRGDLTTAATPAPEAAVWSPARRGNLRTALTSFVGRERDVERVLDALSAHRLVTLVGPGGAGKTRLAVEVAQRWLSDGGAAAWLVELAPVGDADNLAATVLSALGVRETRVTERSERPAPEARDRLLDRLRDARCLIVVDNCEHLVDPVAQLVDDLLAAAPEVRVLATSRELLGLTGELLCAIHPLPLPPLKVSLDAAGGYSAVRLWLDRAETVLPGFRLDQDNLTSVIEIVRRLDGLPLAIELAAARLRLLPVAEIARRLSDRFRLLTGGNRTSLPRHRTLRAVVEWSWDLLTPDERLLAERLAVFPAGADGPSAVAVCADDRLVADELEQVLSSLVDKSLLQVEAGDGSADRQLRYRMLETIREYGIERLAERGELPAARLAHAEHYAHVVIECEPVLRSRDQLAAMARLDVDRDNVSAALRYLADAGRGEQALTVMLALAWYWSVLDDSTEMATWAKLILDANEGVDLPGLAYARAALIITEVTDGSDGEHLGWDAVRARLAEVSDQLAADPAPPFPGLEVLRCTVAVFAGHEDVSDQLLTSARASSDPWLRAAVHASLANLYENGGELERMRSMLDVAYQEFVQIGDRWGLSTSLIARGQLATVDGRLDDAITDFLAARRYIRELGSVEDDIYLQVRLADLLIRRGEFDAARDELADLELPGRAGFDSERALFALTAMVLIEWHSGNRGRAVELAGQLRSELDGRDMSAAMLGHLRGVILATTGLVSALAGDLEQALTDLQVAYPSAIETHDQPIIAAVGTAVAGWLAVRQRFDDAAAVLGAAAAVRGADDWTDRSVATTTLLLRSELGDAFDTAYARARELDRAEAQQRLDPNQYC